MGLIGTIMSSLFAFYNTIFQPVLALGPYVSLAFFSATLAALFSVIYWFLLDIERADEIKDKLSEYQDKMKEARENDEDKKASKHLKKTLQLNQKFMMLNMKPMIVTMVFVGLFFPWLGATYAPSIKMNETGNSTFTGNLVYAGQEAAIKVDNSTGSPEIIVGDQTAELKGEVNFQGIDWTVQDFKQSNKPDHDAKLGLNAKFVELPFSIPLAGKALNWLGLYIVIVMPLTYIFRKILGVQ